jgi:serine/threonine-protein kinase
VAERPADVAMMQISRRPEPPSRRDPHIPAALEKIVLCALEKDPAARFDSAAEMLRMLDRLPDDLLTGRVRPLREEGSAYRMATERLDERTLPLPKSWFRRRATVKQKESAATEETVADPREETLAPPAAPATPAVPPEGELPAAQKVPTLTPIPTPVAAPTPTVAAPPPRRRETPAELAEPPVASPVGNLLDAFTAQDTMDIMLAPSGDGKAQRQGPSAEEPVTFVRRVLPRPEAEEDATENDLTIERPVAPPEPDTVEREETDSDARPEGGFSEHKFFRFFMVLTALVMAVILLFGVVTALREREKNAAADGVYVSAPCGQREACDAL